MTADRPDPTPESALDAPGDAATAPTGGDARGTRICCLSADFLAGRPRPTVADCLDAVDPDAVVVTDWGGGGALDDLRDLALDLPVLAPAAPTTTGLETHDLDAVRVAVAPSTDALGSLPDRDRLHDDRPTIVVSDLLSLSVRRTRLETVLSGREAYVTALGPANLDGYVHVSTAIEGDYRHEWPADPAETGDDRTFVVHGGGAGAGTDGTPIPWLDCWPDGTVRPGSVDPDRLGLCALPGVGARTATRLREAGLDTREAVATADPDRLAELPGIGRERARSVRRGARALADGVVVRTDDHPFPSGDPVFLDVETDGLAASVVWLVGVVDGVGGPEHAFLQRDPREEGRAVAAFLDWYAENARGRPLVAYNGAEFDVPVLDDVIAASVLEHRGTWDAAPTFDPLAWAREHAVLPGRTNRLADVAAALGFEPHERGLDGATVARRYREWQTRVERDPAVAVDGPDAPAWDRLTRYCLDDVRALERVYEALEAAERPADDAGGETSGTTQGTLSDFG